MTKQKNEEHKKLDRGYRMCIKKYLGWYPEFIYIINWITSRRGRGKNPTTEEGDSLDYYFSQCFVREREIASKQWHIQIGLLLFKERPEFGLFPTGSSFNSRGFLERETEEKGGEFLLNFFSARFRKVLIVNARLKSYGRQNTHIKVTTTTAMCLSFTLKGFCLSLICFS